MILEEVKGLEILAGAWMFEDMVLFRPMNQDEATSFARKCRALKPKTYNEFMEVVDLVLDEEL